MSKIIRFPDFNLLDVIFSAKKSVNLHKLKIIDKVVTTLRTKIFSSFFLLVILLVVAAGMSILEFRKIGKSVDKVMENNYKSIEQAKIMTDAIERQKSGLFMYLTDYKQEGREQIMAADSLVRKAFVLANKRITEPDEGVVMDSIVSNYQAYYASIQATMLSDKVDFRDKNNVFFTDIQRKFKETRALIDRLTQLNEQGIYKQSSQIKDNAKRAIMPAIVSVVAAIIFALLLNFFINVYFINPIHRLIDAVSGFYPEQLEVKAKISSKDEIKKLEVKINELISRLMRYRNTKE